MWANPLAAIHEVLGFDRVCKPCRKQFGSLEGILKPLILLATLWATRGFMAQMNSL